MYKIFEWNFVFERMRNEIEGLRKLRNLMILDSENNLWNWNKNENRIKSKVYKKDN